MANPDIIYESLGTDAPNLAPYAFGIHVGASDMIFTQHLQNIIGSFEDLELDDEDYNIELINQDENYNEYNENSIIGGIEYDNIATKKYGKLLDGASDEKNNDLNLENYIKSSEVDPINIADFILKV